MASLAGYNPNASLLPAGGGTIQAMSGGGGMDVPSGYNASASLLPSSGGEIAPFRGGFFTSSLMGGQGENTNNIGTSATTPANAVPVATNAAATPVATNAAATPVATNAVATPVATNAAATPVSGATPVATNAAATPVATNAVATPVATNAAATPVATTVSAATPVTTNAAATPVATNAATTVATTSNDTDKPKSLILFNETLLLENPKKLSANVKNKGNFSGDHLKALELLGVDGPEVSPTEKLEILQALYGPGCNTDAPMSMLENCEPIRRIIQTLALNLLGKIQPVVGKPSEKNQFSISTVDKDGNTKEDKLKVTWKGNDDGSVVICLTFEKDQRDLISRTIGKNVEESLTKPDEPSGPLPDTLPSGKSDTPSVPTPSGAPSLTIDKDKFIEKMSEISKSSTYEEKGCGRPITLISNIVKNGKIPSKEEINTVTDLFIKDITSDDKSLQNEWNKYIELMAKNGKKYTKSDIMFKICCGATFFEILSELKTNRKDGTTPITLAKNVKVSPLSDDIIKGLDDLINSLKRDRDSNTPSIIGAVPGAANAPAAPNANTPVAPGASGTNNTTVTPGAPGTNNTTVTPVAPGASGTNNTTVTPGVPGTNNTTVTPGVPGAPGTNNTTVTPVAPGTNNPTVTPVAPGASGTNTTVTPVAPGASGTNTTVTPVVTVTNNTRNTLSGEEETKDGEEESKEVEEENITPIKTEYDTLTMNGIERIGAISCYCNSAIQLLFSIKEIRDTILNYNCNDIDIKQELSKSYDNIMNKALNGKPRNTKRSAIDYISSHRKYILCALKHVFSDLNKDTTTFTELENSGIVSASKIPNNNTINYLINWFIVYTNLYTPSKTEIPMSQQSASDFIDFILNIFDTSKDTTLIELYNLFKFSAIFSSNTSGTEKPYTSIIATPLENNKELNKIIDDMDSTILTTDKLKYILVVLNRGDNTANIPIVPNITIKGIPCRLHSSILHVGSATSGHYTFERFNDIKVLDNQPNSLSVVDSVFYDDTSVEYYKEGGNTKYPISTHGTLIVYKIVDKLPTSAVSKPVANVPKPNIIEPVVSSSANNLTPANLANMSNAIHKALENSTSTVSANNKLKRRNEAFKKLNKNLQNRPRDGLLAKIRTNYNTRQLARPINNINIGSTPQQIRRGGPVTPPGIPSTTGIDTTRTNKAIQDIIDVHNLPAKASTANVPKPSSTLPPTVPSQSPRNKLNMFTKKLNSLKKNMSNQGYNIQQISKNIAPLKSSRTKGQKLNPNSVKATIKRLTEKYKPYNKKGILKGGTKKTFKKSVAFKSHKKTTHKKRRST
jgi:hypothetical protein